MTKELSSLSGDNGAAWRQENSEVSESNGKMSKKRACQVPGRISTYRTVSVPSSSNKQHDMPFSVSETPTSLRGNTLIHYCCLDILNQAND